MDFLASAPPEERIVHQWTRARGRIASGHQAHLSALAYMTDHYFVGTIARVQGLDRYSNPDHLRQILRLLSPTDNDHAAVKALLVEIDEQERLRKAAHIKTVAEADVDSNPDTSLPGSASQQDQRDDREISMMLSLDHTIFFHNPRSFRADEWMLADMRSHWAGEGRGLVMQRIWSHDGVLIATCVQEVSPRLVSLVHFLSQHGTVTEFE
jgi:hypothetical protein